MKKKIIITILVIILVLIAALSFATIAYSKTTDYKSETFPNNVTINGIDCSGLTYDEAAAKLAASWNKRHIVITGSLGEKITSFTDFGCTYDIMDQLKDVKKNYLLFTASNHYFRTPVSVSIPMLVSECGQDFKQSVMESDFLNNEKATVSQDAYVDTTDPKFPIIPEVYGTKSDSEKFFNDLLHHIQTGDINFVFDEKQYYTMPKITADSKKLKEYQKYCRTYLKQKITYDLGENTFTISAEQLDTLLADDLSGNADEDAIKKYVAQLADKYDNVGANRNFTSLSGKQINVSGGTYGWEIDQKKEAKQLTVDINSHADVTREPVFSTKGYGKYSSNVGNTYIDVDISNQSVKFYKNGSLEFSSSCVTGCRVTGTTTSIGTYYILNKVRNVVLKGDNADGSKYESPVKYWLGVTWSGQGFHDADWRSSFGGSIWISNGSHGCINMPPGRMGSLYQSAEVGTPVIMHY